MLYSADFLNTALGLNLNGALPPLAPGSWGAGVVLALVLVFKLPSLPGGGAIDRVVAGAGVVGTGLSVAGVTAGVAPSGTAPRPPLLPPGGTLGLIVSFGGID